jgi:hypothetical protein
MAHLDRGATSLIWIREQITNEYFTPNPVSAVLEITVKIRDKSHANEEEKKQILDINKNNLRILIYQRISNDLHNKTINIMGHDVNMHFREQHPTKVHHITNDGHIDLIKSQFMKIYTEQLNNQLFLDFPLLRVSVNFLLSKPLEYLPDNNEDLIDDEMAEE